jgi:translation elongation factor P/translation initiation factor 5A
MYNDYRGFQITDLRLGNHLKYKDQLITVVSIFSYKGEIYGHNSIQAKEVFTNIRLDAVYVEPIPLSDDSLKIFELTKKGRYWYSENNYYRLSGNDIYSGHEFELAIHDGDEEREDDEYRNWQRLTTIWFAHQLQNVYYSLERRELTIKLKQ